MKKLEKIVRNLCDKDNKLKLKYCKKLPRTQERVL